MSSNEGLSKTVEVSHSTSTSESIVGQDTVDGLDEQKFTAHDIRRNMTLIILLDAIFVMGFSELGIAMQPLLVHLKASNSMIGLVTGTMAFGLPGVILSPWISRRFRFKKWYMFLAHLPYLGALGILGAGVIFSSKLGISNPSLLTFALVMMIVHMFFAGFVSVPHQEFVAACIPMSHRGRYSGFSLTVGGALSMASAGLGGIILLNVAKPCAYGWLLILTWAIAQSGYILALFAYERPTPIEKSPPAWSKPMIKAAVGDKPFMKCAGLMMITWIVFIPFQTFINVYGLQDLKMMPAKIAVIAAVMSFARIIGASAIGIMTDRLSPKRAIPYFMLLAFLALITPLVIRNEYGVYVGAGFLSLFMAGVLGAFNALVYGIPKPENRAGNFAVQLVFFYIAGSAGPLLIGKICDLLPFRVVFLIFGLLALAFYPFSKYVLSELSDEPGAYC